MAGDAEKVKQKTDIVAVVGEHVELKKAGRNYKALCPFHSEKTPSFIVSPELQIFKCFGCGESGDVISFLQKYENIDFSESLKFLAEKAGISLSRSGFSGTDEKEKLFKLNGLILKFYRYVLLKHRAGKEAFLYLKKERGLKLSTIEIFGLGFSPKDPGALAKFISERKEFSRRDLEKAGIFYSRGSYQKDRFMGRVIFPLFNHRGNIAGFAGRILPSEKRKDIAKYINSPDTPVYHKSDLLYGLNVTKEDIKRKSEAVVVEGELDLLSTYQTGVKNVVALKGSAFTGNQARLLSRYAKSVILAFDADIAGDAAARRGIKVVEEAGLEVKVARIYGYKDPDDMARKDPEKYKKLLKNPQGVWDYIIDSVFSKYKKDSGADKAKISRELIPVLSSISDSIVQAHYSGKVAGRLKVPVSAVIDQISKEKKGEGKEDLSAIIAQKKEKPRRERLEERLLVLAFRSDPGILLQRKVDSLIKTTFVKKIKGKYKKYSENKKGFDFSEFAGQLPSELFDGFTRIVVQEDFDLEKRGDILKETDYSKETETVLREIEIDDLKEKLKSSAIRIRQLEKDGQKNKLEKEEEKFGVLTGRLTELVRKQQAL